MMTLPVTLADALDSRHADPETRIVGYGDAERIETDYRGLETMIAAAQNSLTDHQIAQGSRVGLVGPNSLPLLAAYIAILRMGLVAAPLNHRMPLAALFETAFDAGISNWFCDKLPPDAGTIRRLDLPRPISATTHASSSARISPDDPALLIHTSGSGGRAKGVILSHRSQAQALANFASLRSSLGRMRAIIAAPMFHMNALTFLALAIWSGASFVLMSRFDPAEFLGAIARERVNLISGVPGMIVALADRPEVASLDLSCVNAVNLGSAPLTDAVINATKTLFPNARISNGYGTTEIGPAVFGAHPEGKVRPIQSIGFPAANVSVRLVDGPSGDEGVLEVSGPLLMSGYDGRPDLTREHLRDGWYRTGDLMRRDADGFFYFVGREDDMFVCNGENIYPLTVEQLIEAMPDVVSAAVVPIEDVRRGQIPVAFVTLRKGATVSADEVKRHVLGSAAPHNHPRHVFIVDCLPETPTGKVDKVRLRAEAAARLTEDASSSR